MMQQHCMRCRNIGTSLDESYVNVNATSVHMPPSASMSLSVMRDRESSHADVSSHVKKIQRLHAISESITASATTSLPAMCPECLQILTQMLEKSDARARQEKKALAAFIATVPKPVRSSSIKSPSPAPSFRPADPSLVAIHDERMSIQVELQQLQDELRAVEVEEAAMWTRINDELMAVDIAHDARDASVARLLEMESRLHIIRRMNVWNDAFYIWHKGPFGTINGFCLGRLPRHHIDWHEINAGWGDVALVVVLLMETMDIPVRDFQVVPLGSHSKIRRLHPSPTMEYALDNYVESPFNLGLAALLKVVAHLGEYAEATDSTFRLPYKVTSTL
ncbi:hypothetical protein DYB37_001314 [Aphanomyces astaci]|uniref:Atg6 BARA domain-containing protein n=1 Tax=Aphanomyces astaci TaxID=112090 RepID=A0A3R7E9D1_APHAT|nr:hypothetical protein DYB35_001206 [Aphanomyces astaci]RHZ23246.1 hypothetical protein DYB37_001314 [Aphanomyces astaci]